MAERTEVWATVGLDTTLAGLAHAVCSRAGTSIRWVKAGPVWQHWIRGTVQPAAHAFRGDTPPRAAFVTLGQAALEQATMLGVSVTGSGRLGSHILHVPDRHQTAVAARWIHAAGGGDGRVRIAVFDETIDAHLAKLGVPPDQRLFLPAFAFRSGAPTAGTQVVRRVLRESLHIAESDRVIAACGPAHATTRHDLTLWAGGILHMLNRGFRILVAGSGGGAGHDLRLRHFAASTGTPSMAIFAPELSMAAAALACDVACEPSGLADPHDLLTFMAAGKLIVGAASVSNCRYLASGQNSVLLAEVTARRLAQELQDALAPKEKNARLAEAAAGDAYRLGSAAAAWSAWDAAIATYTPVERQPATVAAGV